MADHIPGEGEAFLGALEIAGHLGLNGLRLIGTAEVYVNYNNDGNNKENNPATPLPSARDGVDNPAMNI